MRHRSWGWRLAGALASVALVLGLAACGDDDESGGAADTSTGAGGGGGAVTLNLGYVTTANHPYGIAIDQFVADVAEMSGGDITITTLPVYPGGDSQLLNDVRGGAVPLASVSASAWDTEGVTSFQALQAPFLITNAAVEEPVITGDIGRAMLESPNGPTKIGLVGLAIHEGGFRKPVGAERPLLTPDDFEGLQLRAPPSNVLAAGLRALGADPTPIGIGEVYGALQNGTVDGMEANLGLIHTQRFYEVADFVTQNVNLWPFPTVLVVNQAVFDGLSAEQQTVLRDAGALVAGNSIQIITNPDPPPAAQFARLLCEEGLTFAFASEADLAALAEAGQTAIDELSQDPEVGDFITQIQAVAADTPPPPPPPPLPAGCSTQGL